MEKVKQEISKLTTQEKVALFELLRDDLGLKTITEMSHFLGKSYNGLSKTFAERVHTTVGRTVYFVSNG